MIKTLLAVVALLLLAGCSAGSTTRRTSPTPQRGSTQTVGLAGVRSLADLQKAMARGGVDCNGKPGPYQNHDPGTDTGHDPIEALECTVDGRKVTASRWSDNDQRVAAMAIAKGLYCGFGTESGPASWIESGDWMVSTNDMSKKDLAVIDRIGKALSVEPTEVRCGAPGTGKSGTLVDRQKAMAARGVKCDGTPAPYAKKKDGISFGPDPVEQLKCTIDRRGVTVRRWKDQDQRTAALYFSAGLICGLDSNVHQAAWIESGNWVLSTDQMTSEDLAVTRQIGRALGIKPTEVNCDTYRAEMNGPTPGSDATGTFGQSVNLGDGTAITLNAPRLDGDDVGPWIDVDFVFVNQSSTTTTMPDVSMICGFGPGDQGSSLVSLSESNKGESTLDYDEPVGPGKTVKGTLDLRQPQFGRDNGLFTDCSAPAVIRIGDEGPTVPVSGDLVAAWDAAAAKARAGS